MLLSSLFFRYWCWRFLHRVRHWLRWAGLQLTCSGTKVFLQGIAPCQTLSMFFKLHPRNSHLRAFSLFARRVPWTFLLFWTFVFPTKEHLHYRCLNYWALRTFSFLKITVSRKLKTQSAAEIDFTLLLAYLWMNSATTSTFEFTTITTLICLWLAPP